MKRNRWLALLLVVFMLVPYSSPLGLHVHAADEGSGYSGLSTSFSCDCDCITYPEMRQLFEEFQYRMTEETNNLHNTMVYNIGWGPSLDTLRNFKVYADLMSGHHLVDWTYYQPKRIENEWREDLFRGDALRAFNVLGRRLLNLYEVEYPANAEKPKVSPVYPAITTTSGMEPAGSGGSSSGVPMAEVEPDQTPIINASGSNTAVGETRGIRLNEKRSLIIMAIYKAIDVEFFNKPVVYSTLLGNPDKPAYRLVDTPFFKQMPSADLKWNEYTVSNVDGHNYLFMDNNYLEAYLVKAVNDRVISQAELTPEVIQLIEKNYISRGSSINGVVSAGSCEDYVLIDRNRGLGPGMSASYEKNELSIIYTFYQGNITYNPAFQAHQSELGTTVLDFCKYAYQILYSNGFPVISKQDRNAMYSKYGAQWPSSLSQEEIDALSYLTVHGIIPDDLTNSQLLGQISTEDILIYLSRIADPDTRLSYVYEVSATDLEMAEDGYAATEITTVSIDSIPQDLTYKLPESAVLEYDYYIPKDERVVTKAPGTSKETRVFFSLDAPMIKPSWGKQLPDVTIGGKKYMHFRLPVDEPKGYKVRMSTPQGDMYVLNSDDPKDQPLYVCVPPGGGFYAYAGEIADGSDKVPYLKKMRAPENLPGNWEGREVEAPDEVQTNLPDLVRFAESSNRLATVSFEIGDYKNVILDNYNLYPAITESNFGNWVPATIGAVSATVKVTVGDESGFLVEIQCKENDIESVTRTIKIKNDSNTPYPAYINKGTGVVLVSEKFLQERCKMERITRADSNYVTFRSTQGPTVETSYIKSINTIVSGSVILSYGNSMAYMEVSGDKDAGSCYLDIRAVSNHLNFTGMFNDATGKVFIDTTPPSHNYTSAHLWTSANVKYDIAVTDSPNKMILNTIPSAISNTFILRHIDMLEEAPAIVQIRPTITSPRFSQTLADYMGSAVRVFSAYDCVDVPLSSVEYDKDTGYLVYDVPDSYKPSDFYKGTIPFPYYMANDSIIQANIPLLNETGGQPLEDYTASSTHNSDWKQLDAYNWATGENKDRLKDAITGELTSETVTLSKISVFYFPVGLPLYYHGLNSESMTVGELKDLMVNTYTSDAATLYFGGGYYTVFQSAEPSNIVGADSVVWFRDVGRTSNASAEDLDQVTANRVRVLGQVDSSPINTRAYVDSLDERHKIPIVSSSVCTPTVAATKNTVYLTDFELLPVSLSGLPVPRVLQDSAYGDILEGALAILGAQTMEDLHKQIVLRNADDWLSLFYVAIIQVLPRILIASLFIIAALSLISNNYYFMWFCEKLFDPVALFSFGLVKRTELHAATIWLSVTLGIIFLVLVNVGTIDTLYSHFFGQLLVILDRLSTGV